MRRFTVVRKNSPCKNSRNTGDVIIILFFQKNFLIDSLRFINSVQLCLALLCATYHQLLLFVASHFVLRYLINEGFWDIRTHRRNLKSNQGVHKRFSIFVEVIKTHHTALDMKTMPWRATQKNTKKWTCFECAVFLLISTICFQGIRCRPTFAWHIERTPKKCFKKARPQKIGSISSDSWKE